MVVVIEGSWGGFDNVGDGVFGWSVARVQMRVELENDGDG